ncbi:MAG TPA: zf-HC2 domain-containing protein, partial [Pyrinomonadaceae bacterium]|nr:zf-HC2 domain-containing protein [Pyrinomonadaceae bacterium]
MEHLSSKQVEGYSLRQLPAAELLAVSDHLGECDVCRSRVESDDAAFFALHEEVFSENGSAGHLTAEQTAGYVDKHLSGEALQFVNDHLAGCERCVLAVADLRAFRNEIAPSLDREYGPTPAPARVGWREKFVSLFRIAPLPAFGGAALAMLLLAAVAWIIWRTPKQSPQEAVVAPTPVSQPAPSVEPSLPSQPAPVVVAQLNDGNGVLSLDREGKLSGADNLPPAYQGLLKKALTSQRIERSSQLQGLTRASSTLMGSDNKPREFAVVEPVGNVVLSNQPAFRWSALEGATGYVVEVYDDQFKLVASSPELTNRSWTVPQSLARGKVYSWQVKAIKDGQEVTSPRPPAPQAKFRVLDQAKAN